MPHSVTSGDETLSGPCDSPITFYVNRLPSYEGRAWFVWPEATFNNATEKEHYVGAAG
jgi:hypothetical protein